MALPDEAQAAAGDGSRPAAMKKSAWTKEEDALLREQVQKHDKQNWVAISEAVPGRNPKSCRLRWCQHLSPDVDTNSAYTAQEDEKIIAYYHRYPNKWATIAGFLPGRTDNAIKNRWHSILCKVYQQRRQTLVLFPLAPGDLKAFGRGKKIVPVLHQPPPGVDLSGECLNLFPLVPGDLVVRGNNAGEAAAAMDVDYSTDESLVELRLWPSNTNHDGGVQGGGGGAGSSGP